MAKEKIKETVKNPEAQGSGTEKKKAEKNGFLFGLLVLLITLIVIVSVVGGVFFIVIKNNVNGLAEKYRNNLKNIPVLRMALPPPPADYDPLDPKNLKLDELIEKYNQFRKENGELAKKLEETEKALNELQSSQAKNPEENDKPEYDMKMEALLKVLNREIPIKAHAHRADDILTAIRIAKEFGLRLTIEHCTEGHLIKDILAEEGVSAIVGPSLTDRSKVELRNLSLKTPGILAKAGVKVAIMTDHPCTPIQYLILCAAMAVREGMDEMEALRAVTINAAELTGIADRVGSIEVGKDADIAIYDGHPFDIRSKVSTTIINGKVVYERKKHERD